MPKAARKSTEIIDQLINMLRSKTKLDDFSFHKYFREIERLNDRLSEDYLKALVYAASGRKEEAIQFFEASLEYGIDTYANNYIVYLSEYCSHKQLCEVANRLVVRYGSKTMLATAWETNLFTGEIATAVHYAERYISVAEKKDAEHMRESSSELLMESEHFKKNAELSDVEYKYVAQRVIDLVDSYGLRASSVAFLFIPEENTTAYIMSVMTDDVEILSDMNIDIAFSLAENEALAGKKFSVWYQGYSEVSTHVSNK